MNVSGRLAIAELVHRYADAVVHRDKQQWGSCWENDARWILGPGRDVTGSATIVDTWLSAMDRFEAVVQHVLNGAVYFVAEDEDVDTATGRWYVIEHFRRRDATVGILLAYYDDAYIRRDGCWRFTRRQLVVQYQGPPDLSSPFAVPPANQPEIS